MQVCYTTNPQLTISIPNEVNIEENSFTINIREVNYKIYTKEFDYKIKISNKII